MTTPPASSDNPTQASRDKAADPQREKLYDGHLVGNLTKDPELRYTPSGAAVVKLTVAYTPRVKEPGSDKWTDGETEFYTVEAWRRLAENLADHLVKGDRIIAVGTWYKRPWTDKEGKERESVEMTAREVGPSAIFKAAVPMRARDRIADADHG